LLAIWTVPPGPDELAEALQTCSPQQVLLFGNLSDMDNPETFLKRLAGLVKYSLKKHDGILHLPTLAAETNQRIPTIRLGLEWLQMHGHLLINAQNSDTAHVTEGGNAALQPHPLLVERLRSMLAESAAYRQYYLRADPDQLVHSGLQHGKH
jgi:hypothetical protein